MKLKLSELGAQYACADDMGTIVVYIINPESRFDAVVCKIVSSCDLGREILSLGRDENCNDE